MSYKIEHTKLVSALVLVVSLVYCSNQVAGSEAKSSFFKELTKENPSNQDDPNQEQKKISAQELTADSNWYNWPYKILANSYRNACELNNLRADKKNETLYSTEELTAQKKRELESLEAAYATRTLPLATPIAHLISSTPKTIESMRWSIQNELTDHYLGWSFVTAFASVYLYKNWGTCKSFLTHKKHTPLINNYIKHARIQGQRIKNTAQTWKAYLLQELQLTYEILSE